MKGQDVELWLQAINMLLNVVTLVAVAWLLGILVQRTEMFRQFMEMLSDIERQHQEAAAIRAEWERRYEQRDEDL